LEIPKILSANIGQHDEIILYGLSDWHLGSEYCDKKLLEKFIETIRTTPNAYCLILGDVMDNALKGSKSNVYTATMNPHQQIVTAANMLYPIRHKILGITEGNHEVRSVKEVGLLPMYMLTTKLAAGMNYEESEKYINGTYSIGAFVSFLTYKNSLNSDRPTTFSLYCKHGNGGGGTVGGKANSMAKMQQQIVADVYMSGHTHTQLAFAPEIFIADPLHGNLRCQSMLNVNTGMLLRWGGYAAEGNYAPSATGTPKIKLWAERTPRPKDMVVKHAKAEIGF
jgi:hypothetical protein